MISLKAPKTLRLPLITRHVRELAEWGVVCPFGKRIRMETQHRTGKQRQKKGEKRKRDHPVKVFDGHEQRGTLIAIWWILQSL